MLVLAEKLTFAFWNAIRRILGLVLPFGSTVKQYRTQGRIVRGVLHIVVLVAILVGLGFLNNFLGLDRCIRARRELQVIWLPLFFFMIYALSWLGRWLLDVLQREEDESAFRDIDEAWAEAVGTLHQAGLNVTDLPLFLILGRPAGGDDALFEASNLPLLVKPEPRRTKAPVHVYATREAMYVTCPGASLLARQAVRFLEERPSPLGEAFGRGQSLLGDLGTLRREEVGAFQDMLGVLRRAKEDGRELTEDEQAQVGRLPGIWAGPQMGGRRCVTFDLSQNAAEVETLTARLRHLCRLIARDRRPYCPVNGLLVLIPLAATNTEEEANQTASICRTELRTAQDALQTHCPILGLLCDLETATGFGDFIQRLAKDQRLRRVGQRFPLVPEVEPAAIPEKIDGGLQWVCTSILPNWIYRLFRLDSPGQTGLDEVVRENQALFSFLCEIQHRHKRLGRIVSHGLALERNGPTLYGGCYLAGTGRDPEREQAFVPGVFQRLIENQNFVSWTAEALEQDARSQQLAQYGHFAIAGAVGILVALLYFLWPR